MEILDKRVNPLMKREELLVAVEHLGMATPRRQEFLALVAKETKAKPDAVVIHKIFTNSGQGKSRARVFVYKSAEDIPKAQADLHKKKLEKGKPKESPKEALKEGAERPAEKDESLKEE